MRVVLSIICKAKCTFVSASNQYDIVAVIQFCQCKGSKLFSLIVVLLVRFAFSGRGVRIYICTRVCFRAYMLLFSAVHFSTQ